MSGYRPLFDFLPTMKTSGQITLLDRTEFKPGEEGEVEIAFGHKQLLGELRVGTPFTFGEGSTLVGEGEVQAIL
jgi:GTPase